LFQTESWKLSVGGFALKHYFGLTVNGSMVTGQTDFVGVAKGLISFIGRNGFSIDFFLTFVFSSQ
jgi:hypothetical protein